MNNNQKNSDYINNILIIIYNIGDLRFPFLHIRKNIDINDTFIQFLLKNNINNNILQDIAKYTCEYFCKNIDYLAINDYNYKNNYKINDAEYLNETVKNIEYIRTTNYYKSYLEEIEINFNKLFNNFITNNNFSLNDIQKYFNYFTYLDNNTKILNGNTKIIFIMNQN